MICLKLRNYLTKYLFIKDFCIIRIKGFSFVTNEFDGQRFSYEDNFFSS